MIKKIGYFSISVVIPQVLSLITIFIFVKYLNVEEFAKIAIFESILLLLQSTVGLAVEKACSRYYHDWKEQVISFASSVTLISSIIIFLLCILINEVFDILNYFGLSLFSFIMLYIAACGYIQTLILLTKYQFEESVNDYLKLSLLKTAPFFIIVILYIFLFDMRADSFIWGHGITGLFLLLFTTIKNKPLFKSNEKVTKLVKYSLPFIPTVLSAWIMNWSNRLFMSGNVDVETLSIYSFLHKISMIYFLFTTSINLYFIPHIYKSLKENINIDKLSNQLIIINIIVVSLISIVLTHTVELFFDYQRDLILIMIYSFFLTNYMSSILAVNCNLILNYNNKTKLQMYHSIFVAAIALLLNYILISKYNFWGVIIAQLIPVIVLTYLRFYYSNIYLKQIKTYYIFLFTLIFYFLLFLYDYLG